MNEPTVENMKALYVIRQNQKTNVRFEHDSKSQPRPLKGTWRFIKNICGWIRTYFSKRDLDLEEWRRIEFRNEYPERSKTIDIRRWM